MGWSVGRLVGWSACHNFLKGREDTLPGSYRITYLFNIYTYYASSLRTYILYMNNVHVFVVYCLHGVLDQCKPNQSRCQREAQTEKLPMSDCWLFLFLLFAIYRCYCSMRYESGIHAKICMWNSFLAKSEEKSL